MGLINQMSSLLDLEAPAPFYLLSAWEGHHPLLGLLGYIWLYSHGNPEPTAPVTQEESTWVQSLVWSPMFTGQVDSTQPQIELVRLLI